MHFAVCIHKEGSHLDKVYYSFSGDADISVIVLWTSIPATLVLVVAAVVLIVTSSRWVVWWWHVYVCTTLNTIFIEQWFNTISFIVKFYIWLYMNKQKYENIYQAGVTRILNRSFAYKCKLAHLILLYIKNIL